MSAEQPSSANRRAKVLRRTGLLTVVGIGAAAAFAVGHGKSANTTADAINASPTRTPTPELALPSAIVPSTSVHAEKPTPTATATSSPNHHHVAPIHSVSPTPHKPKKTPSVHPTESGPASPPTPEAPTATDLQWRKGEKVISLKGQELILTPQVKLWDRPVADGDAKPIKGDNYAVLNARIIEGKDAACFNLPEGEFACINLGDEASTKHIQILDYDKQDAQPIDFDFQYLSPQTVTVSQVDHGHAFYQDPSDAYAQNGQAPLAQTLASPAS